MIAIYLRKRRHKNPPKNMIKNLKDNKNCSQDEQSSHNLINLIICHNIIITHTVHQQ